jgi:hypothetical protein
VRDVFPSIPPLSPHLVDISQRASACRGTSFLVRVPHDTNSPTASLNIDDTTPRHACSLRPRAPSPATHRPRCLCYASSLGVLPRRRGTTSPTSLPPRPRPPPRSSAQEPLTRTRLVAGCFPRYRWRLTRSASSALVVPQVIASCIPRTPDWLRSLHSRYCSASGLSAGDDFHRHCVVIRCAIVICYSTLPSFRTTRMHQPL